MPITPMFHVHAWGVPYVATAMGTKQVYPGRYLPDTLLTLIQHEHVTFSHCVPTTLQRLAWLRQDARRRKLNTERGQVSRPSSLSCASLMTRCMTYPMMAKQ